MNVYFCGVGALHLDTHILSYCKRLRNGGLLQLFTILLGYSADIAFGEDKLSFTGVTLSALWADTLLRNVGNGLPHQCAHWFAMTVVFDTFRN